MQICNDPATGVSVATTMWISTKAAGTTPTVDPYSVALEAENSMTIPPPVLQFNPTGASVVNLPTWLWIEPGIWHPETVTASVGAVTATAVATPTSVVWTMGDGGRIVCDGPGTAYNLAEPPAIQSTTCSYAYGVSSAGQPSPDGNPNDGAFTVTATVNWSVSWSARGVTAGGALPPLATTASTTMRVEQVESLNASLTSDLSGGVRIADSGCVTSGNVKCHAPSGGDAVA